GGAAFGGRAAWGGAPRPPHRARRPAPGLGADGPFFLEGGTMPGLDRGEPLSALAAPPPSSVAIVVPGFGVSTKDAYAWWDGARRDPVRGAGLDRRVNDLQEPVAARHPDITRLVEALRRLDADHASMSGSGSAVFGLFAARAAALRAARRLEAADRRVIVSHTLNRAAYARMSRPVLLRLRDTE